MTSAELRDAADQALARLSDEFDRPRLSFPLVYSAISNLERSVTALAHVEDLERRIARAA